MVSTLRVRDIRTSRANCVGRGEIMFDDDTTVAKMICEGCPERRRCLSYALDNDIAFGVWGGLDFDQRTELCPICQKSKLPENLGCSTVHSLERLARLYELQVEGDLTISITGRGVVSAPTYPGCAVPRGRSHSTSAAYQAGCRCAASRKSLLSERAARPPAHRPKNQPTEERFMALVQIDGEHWWWLGSKNGSGYGNFRYKRRVVRAHIFAYSTFCGPIPPGAKLRRVGNCPSRHCVNPSCFVARF